MPNTPDADGHINNYISMPGSGKQSAFNIAKVRNHLSSLHTANNHAKADIAFEQVSADVCLTLRQLSHSESLVYLTKFTKGSSHNLTITLPGTISKIEFVGHLEGNAQELTPEDTTQIYGSFGHTLSTSSDLSMFCEVTGCQLHFNTIPESFTCVLRLNRETKAESLEKLLKGTDYGSLF